MFVESLADVLSPYVGRSWRGRFLASSTSAALPFEFSARWKLPRGQLVKQAHNELGRVRRSLGD
jgi:hypothetical protein